jgi:hypothetical protein
MELITTVTNSAVVHGTLNQEDREYWLCPCTLLFFLFLFTKCFTTGDDLKFVALLAPEDGHQPQYSALGEKGEENAFMHMGIMGYWCHMRSSKSHYLAGP